MRRAASAVRLSALFDVRSCLVWVDAVGAFGCSVAAIDAFAAGRVARVALWSQWSH
jgi:hypothetical protein